MPGPVATSPAAPCQDASNPAARRPVAQQPAAQRSAARHPAARRPPMEELIAGLRQLAPDFPDLYSVTDLSDGSHLGHGSHVDNGTELGTRTTAGSPWLTAGDVVAAMAARKAGQVGSSPAVAGARLAASLGYAVAGRPAVALAVAGRSYDTGPGSLLLRLGDEGLIEGIGVRNPALAVRHDDPLAGTEGVIVLPDTEALARWTAERVWATLAPLIDEVHQLTRYGRAPMWNLVADAVLGPATSTPRLARQDQRAGRATGTALLDALVDLGAPIRRRGTVFERPATRPTAVDPAAIDPSAAEPTAADLPVADPPVADPSEADPSEADSSPGDPSAADSSAGDPSAPAELVVIRGSCCFYFREDVPKCATCPLLRRP